MPQITTFEQSFTKKVRDFISRTGCDLSTIGNSKTVHYSNVAKLREYIFEERGSIRMDIAGRIDKFMREYGKRPLKPKATKRTSAATRRKRHGKSPIQKAKKQTTRGLNPDE